MVFTGYVVYYVLRDGKIKIGTTRVGRGRWRTHGGDLLITEPGSYDLERHRHGHFAAARIGATEWFHPTEELIRWIRWQQLWHDLAHGAGEAPDNCGCLRAVGVVMGVSCPPPEAFAAGAV